MKEDLYKQIYEWTILPIRRALDIKPDLEKRKIYRNSFRWIRSERVSSFCKPFQTASSIGWSVISPIDITFSPLKESQFEASDNEAQQIANQSGFNHIWNRNGINIGVKTDMPLRLYDFKVGDGWEAMFILNGEGTLEWKLGFSINLKKNQHILILDNLNNPLGLCIPGVLSQEQLFTMNKSSGFSLAIKPKKKISIKRGDIVGTIIIVTDEVINLNSSK